MSVSMPDLSVLRQGALARTTLDVLRAVHVHTMAGQASRQPSVSIRARLGHDGPSPVDAVEQSRFGAARAPIRA
ncbi:hypothetical protein DSL92_01705 [Billgrantia gudaonensis]|uniref:Uncharacterized protein n=1 Tax=Billgrantia gudaonensis TaxID=376427 RepID=A0A432JLF1_9GAMM|nr:hypothetical protein DSL92_01705 [Halomonas gudaonensis]